MTRGRILYIEDNVENRMLVKRILEAEGYQVAEAENGTVGMDKAKSGSPDLILVDINLPDIDGYDVTARLRQTDRIGSIPIVALTANVMEGDRQKALDAGCDGYIPKPIDVDQLTTIVAQFIRKAAEHRTAVASEAGRLPAAPASVPTSAPVPTPAAATPAAPAGAGGQPKAVPPPPALPRKPLPPPPPIFTIPPAIKNVPPPPVRANEARVPAASGGSPTSAAAAVPTNVTTAAPAPSSETPDHGMHAKPPAPAPSNGSGGSPETADKATPSD
jgi:two-component system cell cycle response regulator DivK